MEYMFVGPHAESLASGRPLVFGDQVEASELSQRDVRLADLLVKHQSEAVEAETPNSEAE